MRTTRPQDTPFDSQGLEAQRDYVKQLENEGASFDLMVAASFVRGIRELGYKSNAHAIDELIDNSEQAGATNVHIAFGFAGKSDTKPTALAVIDDGHGMEATMIRAAMMWGGTHREGDRRGFGRFGYGLPSASVSISRRYAVYSWVVGSRGVQAVTFDVDVLAAGKYRSAEGRTVVPETRAAELPGWVTEYIATHFPGGMPASGTVVLLDSLDRLQWKTTKVLREKLSDHLGVTYRNYLRVMAITVDGKPVEPVDPLFLTAGARFFANDAEGLPPAAFEVKDTNTGGSLGVVKVRYSYLPPAQFSKYADPAKKELNKTRTSIRDQFNGLLIMRNGRQLDFLRTLPRGTGWKKGFKNYDSFYKIEIDFPATLDEEFSVTTSKQQVVLSERMWDLLKQIGVTRVMTDLYGRAHKDLQALRLKTDEKGAQTVRTSEQVMDDIQKYKARRSAADPEARQREAEKNRQEYVRKRAVEAKVPEEVIERQYEAESKTKIHVVETENLPGAPFYRVIPRGSQIVLLINEGHRFYDDLYAAFSGNPQLRSGLELLLFVVGESELDASPDRRRFYETERAEWSRVLNTALDRLSELNAAEFETEAEEALDDDATGDSSTEAA
jgi:hypothetical protein